jgi:hypothetical protein
MLFALLPQPFIFAQRTQLKPGINFFSPKQDVELGRQVAQDAEKKFPMLNNQRVDDYLDRLGKKLAAFAPGEKFPYQFRGVNDASVNAFALPGGFLFINRGTVEAAENEAQLASVIGHEIAHVALRHGTNQASKAYIAQVPLAVVGTFWGGNSVGAILAQIGTSFATNSILLKYSRDDERQADLMGAQILYDANYDPRNVAQFFQKLETGKRGTDFFSSHPNPGNRIQNINLEIGRLGEISRDTVNDSAEFRSVRMLLKSLPPAPKIDETSAKTPDTEASPKPPRPSVKLKAYDSGKLSLSYPENWDVLQSDKGFSLAPRGGVVRAGSGSGLAYGVIVEVFRPDTGNRSSISLEEATYQLIKELLKSNSSMQPVDNHETIRVGGRSGLSKILLNDSPLGGGETDWLVTVLRPEGLVYFVFVAPEHEYGEYQPTFEKILNSVRFQNR